MEHFVIVRDRSEALSAKPAIFVCGDCGIEENSLDRKLPQGWDKYRHEDRDVVRCGDCNEAVEREHRPPTNIARIEGESLDPLVVDPQGWVTLESPSRGTPMSYFLYNGFRIGHWAVPEAGSVVIQLHGGTAPGAQTIDDAVVFSLRLLDLRDLIQHLEGIEAELLSAAPARTPFRKGRANG